VSLGKLGSFDFPEYKFSRVLEVVEKIRDLSNKGEISRTGLAELLKMNIKGGGFHALLASLRDFGLLEGREQLKITDLGKRLVAGASEEAERAKAESFLNVSLFKELYQRAGATVPDDEKFLVLLREVTKEDTLKVKSQYKDVLSVYSDGIRYLDILRKPEMGGSIVSATSPQIPVPTEGQQFIEIRVGPYFQRLPFTPKGFDLAVAFLQGLKEEETKSA